MKPADYARTIRSARDDLTEYVVHLTRARQNPATSGLDVLLEILRDGLLKPTFAPYWKAGQRRPGVKGPYPTVCLTEQPVSALLTTVDTLPWKYAPYGIAYYKPTLFENGGRAVLYASKTELGRKLGEREPGWEKDKDIYAGTLPPDLQYLWVNYDPSGIGPFGYTVDFTWEREWRVRIPNFQHKQGLPVALRNPWGSEKGAILVQHESELDTVRAAVQKAREAKAEWTEHVGNIIAFETARRKLKEGNRWYARLETWPGG
jgi:hypothetical protein